MIRLYVDRVDLGSREDRDDHLWTQILRFYFKISENYGIERESYRDEWSLARTNIVLTNIRGGEIKKAIFVECKRRNRSGRDATNHQWSTAEEELQGNMVAWRTIQQDTDLYGILALGYETRFFKMPTGTNKLEGWVHDPSMQDSEVVTLSISGDSRGVHQYLQKLRELV